MTNIWQQSPKIQLLIPKSITGYDAEAVPSTTHSHNLFPYDPIQCYSPIFFLIIQVATFQEFSLLKLCLHVISFIKDTYPPHLNVCGFITLKILMNCLHHKCLHYSIPHSSFNSCLLAPNIFLIILHSSKCL
jgi:hypothetical protein